MKYLPAIFMIIILIFSYIGIYSIVESDIKTLILFILLISSTYYTSKHRGGGV